MLICKCLSERPESSTNRRPWLTISSVCGSSSAGAARGPELLSPWSQSQSPPFRFRRQLVLFLLLFVVSDIANTTTTSPTTIPPAASSSSSSFSSRPVFSWCPLRHNNNANIRSRSGRSSSNGDADDVIAAAADDDHDGRNSSFSCSSEFESK